MEIKQLHHCSLMVEDVERAKAFYCGILGMEQVPHPPHYDFNVAWCRKGDAEVHLVRSADAIQPPGDPPVHVNPPRDATFARHLCLRVADLNEAVNTLREHNWPIVAGPRARGDGGDQLYIRDPDGHLVELACLPWLD